MYITAEKCDTVIEYYRHRARANYCKTHHRTPPDEVLEQAKPVNGDTGQDSGLPSRALAGFWGARNILLPDLVEDTW